CLQYNSNPLTF
nr:immunoglobulin light chain junction region [Macaca mulatta]MOW11828.1 immunoglobulin light chain junction region [Macaca mulatta]MOW14843.1 immunoglobulin light chain junction region [Macaca mulatta]